MRTTRIVRINRGNVLSFIIARNKNSYTFKFPDIKEKLIVKLGGEMLPFQNNKQVGEFVRESIAQELKDRAYAEYKEYKRKRKESTN